MSGTQEAQLPTGVRPSGMLLGDSAAGWLDHGPQMGGSQYGKRGRSEEQESIKTWRNSKENLISHFRPLLYAVSLSPESIITL